ncbi:protein TFG-like [Daphnia carinata]|uniref:protein TFG-like n=1 Tax=Daphnia carinata TaxID=120202 RepID=UPI0025811316|nr:protein TFG-like [Daphnia carinata]
MNSWTFAPGPPVKMNSEWDLKEKLDIKVQLHDDIRRIQIHNKDVTYDHLVRVMQQLFNGKISRSDELLLKYKDEDGDLVTIFDTSDLEDALESSSHHTLKLMIFLNFQAQESAEDIKKHDQEFVACQVSTIRKELACIRDQVLHLLDELDTPQDTLSGKNDGVHLVISTDTQSEKANNTVLRQFDQREPRMHDVSSSGRGENVLVKHCENRAGASPYPNDYQQQALCKRGFQPLLSSTSYGLPAITVYPDPDELFTQESANYPLSSYSPRPVQQQSYNHQLISSYLQDSSELPFTDPSRTYTTREMQIQTSPQRHYDEYNFDGYHLPNAVHPVNPYRRSPRPARYP